MTIKSSHLRTIVKRVINENPEAVEDYRNGEGGAINFLVGQVVEESNGKASPNVVRSVLTEEL